MATPARALRPCAITVNIFSGARTAMPAGSEVLLTLRDGNQNPVPLPHNGYFKASTINVEALPFFTTSATITPSWLRPTAIHRPDSCP